MENIIQYAKPQLIVLSEKKKIRDYVDETKKLYTVKLVKKLLLLLGVNEGKQDVHNALALHIISAYNHFTFEQIDKAFELFVSGALKSKPFQQLNAVVFGQVMVEYAEYEKEQTKVYRQKLTEFNQQAKPMSEEEKDNYMNIQIEKAIKEFEKTGNIDVPTAKYDYLFAKGKIQGKLSKTEFEALKRAKYNSVQNRLIGVYASMKATTFDEKIEIKNIQKQIEENKSGIVVMQCKLEMVQDYFNDIIKNKVVQ